MEETLVREACEFLDGSSLVKAAACCATWERAALGAARDEVRRRFGWFWPGVSSDALPSACATWISALGAFESQRRLCLVVGGTRDESSPTSECHVLGVARESRADAKVTELRPPSTSRNAAAAARDATGDVWLVGGWDGQHPLISAERLCVKSGAWRTAPQTLRAKCFAAAAFAPWDASSLWLFGGASSLWVGGIATADTEILDAASDLASWRQGPPMLEARCGHGVVPWAGTSLVACGGYSGGDRYLRSCEMLSQDGRWSQAPAMREIRTGAGFALGPDGCIYAAGGSPDGSEALGSAERLDARTRRWERLPAMRRRRNYVAACFTPSQEFLVHGGYDNFGELRSSTEVFDVRKGQWRALPWNHAEDATPCQRAQHALVCTVLKHSLVSANAQQSPRLD